MERKTKKVKKISDKIVSKPSKVESKSNKESISENTTGEKIYSLRNKIESSFKWYVLKTQPGKENTVAQALRQRISAMNFENYIDEVVVPTQKKVVIKDGKQKVQESRSLPGYIFVRMILDVKSSEFITNVEGFRGFLKTDKYPQSLPDNQIKAIKQYKDIEQKTVDLDFSVGDAVKVVSGHFANFIGNVKDIDASKNKVTIMLSMFGREAPVELDFADIVKI